MTKIEEIQDQVTQEAFPAFKWNDLRDEKKVELMPFVCKRYAQACCEASLQEAAMNADTYIDGRIVVSTITNPSNIKLL